MVENTWGNGTDTDSIMSALASFGADRSDFYCAVCSGIK